uniref:uncharacterized protein LOC122605939 isoform X2 n=1 Tax=Erigeron canadensis TaxID=72917 RepID=UPI001CB95052|nr:uncharacterized protein LOC122605939 isoform X2 [Erigeron canadensis]
MPQRKNSNKKGPSTSGVVTLRRSPRFLQMVLFNPENPITSDPEPPNAETLSRTSNQKSIVHEGPVNVMDVNKMIKSAGVKRTRNEFENSMGLAQDWTKEQELALERAYQEAKPTPRFWKKVSRMVPGKSAQECFDKVHCSHLTPPQPRMRARPRVLKSLQNSCLVANKLLNASSPAAKRPRYHKQKSHVVQRTIRHMIQNQYKVVQESAADLFSVLEPAFAESVNGNRMFTTPDRNPNEVLKRCQERSSTAHKKSVSKFSSLDNATLASPPVLKPVKNKALHEKYIDQLNCREAKRKAANEKAEKLDKSKGMKQESSAERKIAIKTAKNALVFSARDAINEFQHQQATALNDFFDYESGTDSDKDDSEVFL